MMIDWHYGQWRLYDDDTEVSGADTPLYTHRGDIEIPGPVTLVIADNPSSHGWVKVPCDVHHFINALKGQHASV